MNPQVTHQATGFEAVQGLLIWRWRRSHEDAARATSPLHGAVTPLHRVARAAHPPPKPRAAIERPAVHLHVHGVSAEDIAAILARHQDGPA